MTLTTVVEIVRKLIDILLVWLVLYYVLKSLRKNVKMILLLKGIIFILLLVWISDVFNLTTIGYLLDEREKVVYEIVTAMEAMKKTRTGALIVIERDNSLNDYIDKSKKIYADISSELLVTLFFPNNPLHDGGVIIQGDKITSARAVFPTSDNLKISKRLGTRHRAALGISELTDCISLVVSEETGRLSVAIGGELHYNLSADEVKLLLLDGLRPKQTMTLSDEEEEEDENAEEDK